MAWIVYCVKIVSACPPAQTGFAVSAPAVGYHSAARNSSLDGIVGSSMDDFMYISVSACPVAQTGTAASALPHSLDTSLMADSAHPLPTHKIQ